MRLSRALTGLGPAALAVAALASLSVAEAARRRAFELEIRHRHGVEWTRVYAAGGKWVCETEAVPYAEAPQDPLEGYESGDAPFDWAKAVGAAAEIRDPCGSTVRIRDGRARGKPTRWSGCLTQPVRALFRKLNRRCRAAFP